MLLFTRIAFMASGLIKFSANPLFVQQWFPKNRVAFVNTVSTVITGVVGGTVVFFLGDLISLFNGWRNVFYVFAAAEAVLLVAWLVLAKEQPSPEMDTDAGRVIGIKNVLKNKTLWLLGIGVTGDMMCFGAMETLWPKYATSLGIISLGKAGYCEGLSYYGFTIGSLLGGFMSMKLGRRKPAIWLSGLLLPFVTLGILHSRSFAMLAFLWMMWGIAGLYVPVISTIPYELPGIKPREVPVAAAFVVSVFTAGAGLGPLLAGYLAGVLGSLERALTVICVFPVLLFITGLMIKETGPKALAR
jgi:CP family cyanate transporter-like MFS transporter